MVFWDTIFLHKKIMDQKDHNKDTLQGTNMSPPKWHFESMIFRTSLSVGYVILPWRIASPSLGSLLLKSMDAFAVASSFQSAGLVVQPQVWGGVLGFV